MFIDSLEEKMHTIMGATNDMSGNLYITPREAVEQLNQCALLERAACLPPEPEDVNKLLRKIVSYLQFIERHLCRRFASGMRPSVFVCSVFHVPY